MRKIRLLAAAAALAVCELASAGANLTVGTYNIRYRTLLDYTDDPATNKYWDARADNVAQTIRDGGFDIIALNELRDDTSYDGHSALKDMQRNFPAPEWAFVMEDSKPSHEKATVHAVLYKTSVVEELEHGKFWLSPTPDKYNEDVYDSGNQARMTLWVKFRAKSTGEIFYYFETHLHHEGNMAKNEGSRLNVDMGRRITGGYPVFICGDHNSRPDRLPFYDLYDAYFDDSRVVAESVSGSEGTCNVWNSTTWKRLDYVWVRGAKVNSYSTIENKYDKNFYPSDHFPIVINVTLEEPHTDRVKYVSADAASGGDGSETSPFDNLQDALDSCVDGDTIRVTAGTYLPTYTSPGKNPYRTFNVERSVTVEGGYNADFSAVEGVSVFSGDLNGDGTANDGDAAHVFTIGKDAAFELSDATVTGGYSKGTNGAGIWCQGPRVRLDRVTVKGNVSKSLGAGVYAYGQIVARNCTFEDNETTGNGGAVYADYNSSAMWWFHHISDCRFSGNKALGGSAIYIAGSLWTNIFNNTFDGNTATSRGTVALAGTKIATAVSILNNTFVNNRIYATNSTAVGGSAILINDMKTDAGASSPSASVAIANNTIVNNECVFADGVNIPSTFHGAAVQATNAIRLYLNNNIIAGNHSAAANADVYLGAAAALVKTNSTYNLFSSAESISFSKEYSDIVAADASKVAEYLAGALDGEITDGRFIPRLADNGGTTPTVKIIEPSFAGKALNCVKKVNLREDEIMADVDADRQMQKATLATDQRGVERNLRNKACIGAYEWNEDEASGVNGVSVEEADGPVEYFNLQGMRTDNPTGGIYIRRQGAKIEKVYIR